MKQHTVTERLLVLGRSTAESWTRTVQPSRAATTPNPPRPNAAGRGSGRPGFTEVTVSASAWCHDRDWAAHPDGWFAVLNDEVLAAAKES